MKRIVLSSLVLLLASLSAIGFCRAEPVRISVAASMTDACKQIISAFTKTSTDITVQANYSSSGALARQIVQGAPADLYISANPQWMTYLEKQHKIAGDTISLLTHNTLVFVGRAPIHVTSLTGLVRLKRIAIGSPNSVPAGQYAMQAMQAVHIYRVLLTEGKLVMAKDVRQALIYADRGEVDGAMVYKTDALLARQAKILFTVPKGLYDQITYPMAMTVEGSKKPEARAFFAFLKSGQTKNILKKFGFENSP